MKSVFFLVTVAALVCATQRARAVESRGDVESDHIDAADDGGPRTAGFAVNPLSIATGWLGAEADVACSERAVLSLEGDARWVRGIRGFRAVVGVALFPQRFSFHGLYVQPRFEWDRATAGHASAGALGGGVTVGYAWTWPIGAAVRLGGGIAYGKGSAGDGRVTLVFAGLHPVVDADLGWVF